MFAVRGSGGSFTELSARAAAAKARELRQAGASDVQIFRPDGRRISLYALEELIRSSAGN